MSADLGIDAHPAADLTIEGICPLKLEPGTVTLIGGGPGALDLITVRGLALLKQADVVLVDRLGPAALTSLLGTEVEIIEIGKVPGKHSVPQREIEKLLIEHAQAGKRVVRLKGGDPFVLGRGGEEVLACRAAGVPVQVVPGVTSAVAAGEVVGIPVTHREATAAFHVVNAHGDLGPADIAALRDPATTTVLLMGVEWLPRIVDQARLNGVSADLPVAIVQAATLPGERVVYATLDTAVSVCDDAGIGFPAVVYCGRTAVPGFLDPAAAEAPPLSPKWPGAGRDATPPGPLPHREPKPITMPPLIGCAHGTRYREGRDVLRAIIARLVGHMGDVEVREAFVDIQKPTIDEVIREVTQRPQSAEITSDIGAIVVPLLLSDGLHVTTQIEAATLGTTAVRTDPLGPDPRLAKVMAERLTEAGWQAGDAVVLAAAGTRDAVGQAQVREAADQLAELLGCDVTVGNFALAEPTVADAVAATRGTAASGRVALATYLLAPGHFANQLTDTGADVIADPIGDHPALAEIVRDRYHAALTGLGG